MRGGVPFIVTKRWTNKEKKINQKMIFLIGKELNGQIVVNLFFYQNKIVLTKYNGQMTY